MIRNYYFPATLGIRRSRNPTRGAAHERTYDGWSEVNRAQAFSFTPVPEAQVFQALKRAAQPAGKLWMVVGEPGSGKSTLFAQWFRRWGSALSSPRLAMAVPVLIRLRELRREDFDLDGESLARVLWRKGCEGEADLEQTTENVYEANAVNRLTPVWLLDGLDELPHKCLSRRLFQRLVKLPGAKAVSCRTALYDRYRDVVEDYTEREYQILALDPEEQAAFLSGVLSDDTLHRKLQGNPQLRVLAGSPFLLTLIARTIEDGDLPSSRSRFYEMAVSRMWLRPDARLDCDRFTASRDETLTALAKSLPIDQVFGKRRLLDDTTQARGCTPPRDMINCLDRSGILALDASRESFAFGHLTFHEYFLACSFQPSGVAAALEKYWIYAPYEETLALLISLLVDRGEEAAVADAICDFVKNGEASHWKDPTKHREHGRSPLRVALHVLARAGEHVVARGTRLEQVLVDAVSISSLRKQAVASDDRMPPWLLAELASDPDEEIQSLIAKNRSVPSLTCTQGERKRQEEWPQFQEATDPGTSPSRLADLAVHAEAEIQEAVARNPSTPADSLERLAAAGGTIRGLVARNAGAPEGLQLKLFHAHPEILVDLASNPNVSSAVLSQLAVDGDPAVKGQAASAPSASPELLDLLANDVSDLSGSG